MSDEFDELKEAYKVEAAELLADFESVLIDLEDNPNSSDVLEQVLRLMHSLKGSADMVGFSEVAGFTHELETFFEQIRDDNLDISPNLVNLILKALDLIKMMLGLRESEYEDHQAAVKQILIDVKTQIETDSGKKIEGHDNLNAESPSADEQEVAATSENQDKSNGNGSSDDVSYRIIFKPHITAFKENVQFLDLLEDIKRLGDCVITAMINTPEDLEAFDPEDCFVYWDIVLTTSRQINDIKDIFIFIEDKSDIQIQPIDDLDDNYKKLGDILVEKGDLKEEQVEELLSDHKKFGEKAVEKGLVEKEKVESALKEQNFVREKKKEKTKSDVQAVIQTIRVESHKLDHMVDLVGELVTVQSSLTQLAARQKNMELQQVAEQVERLTTELRENAMSIRMVQIGTIFTNFKRLVRDLSNQLDKKVNFQTFGGETELDKTIVEQIKDPLIHIIRNSVDHGIESRQRRIENSKDEEGTVHLKAFHSGGYVNIEIIDDGGGMNPEKLRQKAIEKGLISEQDKLTDKQCFELIFHSGFSTAGQVTNVSGRGVGMDVVRKTVQSLGGNIEITSEEHVGTTFLIRLPLTLAIIDGLLVSIGKEKFIVPLSVVHECVEIPREKIVKGLGRKLTELRGEQIPYVNLRDEFVFDGEGPSIQQVVVVKIGENRVGLVVDNIIGKHQTVIKTLSGISKEADCISGATILGDGGVALILDVQKLSSSIEKRELTQVAV